MRLCIVECHHQVHETLSKKINYMKSSLLHHIIGEKKSPRHGNNLLNDGKTVYTCQVLTSNLHIALDIFHQKYPD